VKVSGAGDDAFFELKTLQSGIAWEFGAGDEARTRNFQLGKLNVRPFIFNTYKTLRKKCTCMRCIPCIHCLNYVSLRDVCGTACQLICGLVITRKPLQKSSKSTPNLIFSSSALDFGVFRNKSLRLLFPR
jgi:hypothetical protein